MSFQNINHNINISIVLLFYYFKIPLPQHFCLAISSSTRGLNIRRRVSRISNEFNYVPCLHVECRQHLSSGARKRRNKKSARRWNVHGERYVTQRRAGNIREMSITDTATAFYIMSRVDSASFSINVPLPFFFSIRPSANDSSRYFYRASERTRECAFSPRGSVWFVSDLRGNNAPQEFASNYFVHTGCFQFFLLGD